MNPYRMRLPDVGEGVAEAELVQWFVAVGDEVTSESVLAEVLTDKATIEVASPVAGVVTALHGEPGDVLAVGSEFVEIDTGAADSNEPPSTSSAQADVDATTDSEPSSDAASAAASEVASEVASEAASEVAPDGVSDGERPPPARVSASPAVRKRAESLGFDLATATGTGPGGRVEHADLDRLIVGSAGRRSVDTGTAPAAPRESGLASGRPEPVRGVRRKIAARLTATWTQVPHITYVEAVDVTELERLRETLKGQSRDADVRLTLLPFIARAIAVACTEQPRLNAHYDATTETLTAFEHVHLGIATQTDQGLLVPVIRDVAGRDLWDLAAELTRVSSAARDGSATRDELTGSTITVTSLGAVGGLVTTPILNAPEVAIVGVNKIEVRPVWRNGAFEPRRMLNLSSSFDHRMIDGWDAATFVQRLKSLLETPALLFIESG